MMNVVWWMCLSIPMLAIVYLYFVTVGWRARAFLSCLLGALIALGAIVTK